MEQELNRFAARNACTARNTARERRFKLLRDLKAVEGTGRQLQMVELMIAFGEWHRLSLPFLDPKKTRSDYLAAFLAEFGKVRVPTGEGAFAKAVWKLDVSRFPIVPEMPDACETWRRLRHCTENYPTPLKARHISCLIAMPDKLLAWVIDKLMISLARLFG